MRIYSVFQSLTLCFLSLLTGAVLGQISDEAHELGALFEQNCSSCHGPETQTAGINLTSLTQEQPLVKNIEIWRRVIGALDVGKMPPPGAPQPSVSERNRMLELLRDNIENYDFSEITKKYNFENMDLAFSKSAPSIVIFCIINMFI